MNEKTKHGIANLKPLLALGIEMGNVADKMGRTKGMARYAALLDLFDEVTGLAKVDWKLLDDEVKDLDAVEREELHLYLKVKFDIANDKLEMAVEQSMKLLEKAYGLIDESIELAKGLKA